MKKPASHAGVKAFTRIELVVTVLAVGLIIGLSVLWARQTMRKSRDEACRNNLIQVGICFRIWAGNQLDDFPMEWTKDHGGTRELIGTGQAYVHFRAMSNELGSPKILMCPADKQKTVATNFNEGFSDENVSYFVGLDATAKYYQMFLSGDRNMVANGQPVAKGLFILTTNTSLSWTTNMHNSSGNIGFVDGSARFLTSDGLAQANQKQDFATNRLAIP